MAKGSGRHKGGRRKRAKRVQLPSFHIFCEGVSTEPNYFNQFPIPNIAYCRGFGQTKMALVKTALS